MPIDYEVLPSGAVVLVDANDIVISEVIEAKNYYYDILISRVYGDEGTVQSSSLRVWNDDEDGKLGVGATFCCKVYYLDAECESQPYTGAGAIPSSQFRTIDIDGSLFATNIWTSQSTLFKGQRTNGYAHTGSPTGNCEAGEYVRPGFTTLSPLILPEKVTNAVYPLRLEQLP